MNAQFVYPPQKAGELEVWLLTGSGPSSYSQTTGDVILGPGGGEHLCAPESGFLTKSGNYRLEAFPSIVNNLRPTWAFRWLYAPSNTAVASMGTGLPLGLGPLSAASTLSAVASGVGTITVANSLKAGQFVLLTGFTQLGALNGTIVQVASATATAFTFNLGSAANVTSGADTTGHFQLVQVATNNPLQTGTVATITNSLATSALLTMTCANSFVPGNFVVIQGLTNGATANGVIVRILTASATQFTATWTGTSFLTGADAGTATLLVTNGNAPVTIGTTAVISNSVATASSAGTAGVITLAAANNFVPGNIVVVSGLTNGAAVNGDVLTVISTSLTNAEFKANGQTASITTGADAGVASMLVTGQPVNTMEVPTGTNLSAEVVQFSAVGGQL